MSDGAGSLTGADHLGALDYSFDAAEGSSAAKDGATPSKQAKRGANDRRQNHHSGPAQDKKSAGMIKRCNTCKTDKKINEFWPQQGCCKDCTGEKRRFNSCIVKQQGEKWLQEQKVKDPELMEDLRKIYDMKMKGAKKAGKVFSFNTRECVDEVLAQRTAGKRRTGKFMFEGEYLMWAQSHEGGFHTESSAKAQWKEWFEDEDHPREFDRRNQIKLCNPDWQVTLENFDAVVHNRALRSSGQIGKNVSDEQLSERASIFLSGAGGGKSAAVFSELEQKVRAQPATGSLTGEAAQDSLLRSLAMPSTYELLQEREEKKKESKARKGQGKEEDEDVDSDSNEDTGPEVLAPDGKRMRPSSEFDAFVDANSLRR